MADLTPEQIGELLDERLRPIQAKLDELSKSVELRTERPDAIEARSHRRNPKQFAAALSIVLILVGVVLVGRMVLGASDGSSGQPSGSTAGRLLYADDFASSATRLFLDRQQGVATLSADGARAQWDYAYQDGALVAHIGPPSLPLSGRPIGGSARAADRLTGDFAFEVKARATRLAAQAVYGLRYFPGNREFGFGVQPSQQSYQVWEIFKPPVRSSRNAAVAQDDLENFLRLEVRGSALRLFVNGQAIDRLQDEAFGARPASVGVFFDTSGAPTDGVVEVRYTDFKVFSLGAQ